MNERRKYFIGNKQLKIFARVIRLQKQSFPPFLSGLLLPEDFSPEIILRQNLQFFVFLLKNPTLCVRCHPV